MSGDARAAREKVEKMAFAQYPLADFVLKSAQKGLF